MRRRRKKFRAYLDAGHARVLAEARRPRRDRRKRGCSASTATAIGCSPGASCPTTIHAAHRDGPGAIPLAEGVFVHRLEILHGQRRSIGTASVARARSLGGGLLRPVHPGRRRTSRSSPSPISRATRLRRGSSPGTRDWARSSAARRAVADGTGSGRGDRGGAGARAGTPAVPGARPAPGTAGVPPAPAPARPPPPARPLRRGGQPEAAFGHSAGPGRRPERGKRAVNEVGDPRVEEFPFLQRDPAVRPDARGAARKDAAS